MNRVCERASHCLAVLLGGLTGMAGMVLATVFDDAPKGIIIILCGMALWMVGVLPAGQRDVVVNWVFRAEGAALGAVGTYLYFREDDLWILLAFYLMGAFAFASGVALLKKDPAP